MSKAKGAMPSTPSTLESGTASIRRHADTATAVEAAVQAGRNLPQVPAFSSMLHKKAANGLPRLRPWVVRYFVLDDSGLSWFASESASSGNRRNASGRVPLHQLMSAQALPSKGQYRFVLNIRVPRGGGRTYMHLKAESDALMHRWLELISRHHQEASAGLCFHLTEVCAPAQRAAGARLPCRPPRLL